MALRNIAIMLVLTILYELSDSTFFDGRCCVRIPRAMDINTFQSRVATGEEWAEIFFFICPQDPVIGGSEQFRHTLNYQNGVLSRRINQRFQHGAPCVGASNDSFGQVGFTRAVFRRPVQAVDGLRWEDRYLNTLSLDDYVILFVCRDPDSAIRGRCFNYFFSLLIREDPPRNFPWDKALSDLRRYGIDAREVIFTYVDEICPVT